MLEIGKINGDGIVLEKWGLRNYEGLLSENAEVGFVGMITGEITQNEIRKNIIYKFCIGK